jgi:hypothetical protein
MRWPVFFVVERWNGRLCSSLLYDGLPKAKDRRVYAKRVDDKPHLAGRSRQELHDIWETLGDLPDQQPQTE